MNNLQFLYYNLRTRPRPRLRLYAGQTFQPLPLNPHAHPLVGQTARTHGVARVEADGVDVPPQHAPLQPAQVALDALARERAQQRAAEPAPSLVRPHEQVFHVDARPALPRRVVVEVEGHAGGRGCGRGGVGGAVDGFDQETPRHGSHGAGLRGCVVWGGGGELESRA